ncbi:MAG: hypothetical protein LUI12_05235 [Clostridiales bacterium]|nr:hypothetical protein [Clostridiales bacterium]
MNKPKAIQTEYKGYLFRSRLEARWAVFFDACDVSWEYEPEGFELGNGQYYLPDFLLHGVEGRAAGDLYVEVKGVMTKADAAKIYAFSMPDDSGDIYNVENPTLVVAGIPDGDTIGDIEFYCEDIGYSGFPGVKGGPYPFNFETIDGDYFVAHPGINKNGHFELFGDDNNYTRDRDDEATLEAFRLARQARFEHGETPGTRRRHHA